MLDFYATSDLFTTEERQVQATVRAFLDAEAAPHVRDWWEQGVHPRHLAARFGEMGLFGSSSAKAHGPAAISNVAYGLIMYELERVDSGLRSFASVQGGLVMYPIEAYGSDDQVRRYLPELARGSMVGCFALTEHEGGSDPGSMRATATRDGGEYVLNGVKMWITNGSIADIAIVWAKDDEGVVRGFIVPGESPGLKANPVEHKLSLRASDTAELALEDVRVRASQMLPGARGLSAPLSCLTQGRYGIAWGALGALEAVYLEALEFAKARSTFGRPIASRQLVQAKLVDMLSAHTWGLLLAWRLGRLKDDGRLKHAQVSLAKRENVRAALTAARSAREILGGAGITTDYDAIRHMLNLESVDTYEGAYDVHTLVLGREVTGMDALQ